MKMTETWNKCIAKEKAKPYFAQIMAFLDEEMQKGVTINPKRENWFRAFQLTPFNAIKVVILGQDPYPNPAMATGLAFSVPKNEKIPQSLRNIMKERENDLQIPQNNNGNLENWAEQGVLLLNTCLTTQKGKAGAHRGIGWEVFTDKIIQKVSEEQQNVVFWLWGKSAQQKRALIDETKHLVLVSPHPSPLSAYRGFFGNQFFSKTNDYLQKKGKKPINW